MSSAPLVHRTQMSVAAVAAAADDSTVIARAPFAGTVTGVAYAADTAITGVATNTRRISVRNRGQDGTATTEVAALQFDAGVNAAAYDERNLPLTANVTVAEGDVLEWFSDSIGTGLADPGGLVTITLSRS